MSQINISVDQGDQVLLQLSTDVPAVAAAALRSAADSIDPPKPVLRDKGYGVRQLERQRDGKR